MKKALLLLFLAANIAFAQHIIIPAPVRYEPRAGGFDLYGSDLEVFITDNNPDAKRIVDWFLTTQKLNIPYATVAKSASKKRAFSFTINKKANPALGAEGYVLDVSNKVLSIEANQAAGLFYGLQTVQQLRNKASIWGTDDGGWGVNNSIKNCKITDYPRFGWRGLMLDVSRHFFTTAEVKAYIDLMAQYKFNTLHWHLTDDNGWRVEIKSLPKLTEVGAWRVQRTGHFNDREDPKDGEPATYGGFYTQDQIREVVQYAAERQITIVPEIDVPGHSMAALAAYPELSTRKEPKKVNPGTAFSEWYADGTFKMLIENTLNPADEKVYEFLDKVFTEIAQLFPNPYIHMGGDECYHGFWEADAGCQAFMKINNLKNVHELQNYFVKRCEKIVQSKGKKLIGWDEILEGGIAPTSAIMAWRGTKLGIEAVKQQRQVVMSPTTYAYFDYQQGDASVETPIYSSISLRKAYEFDPAPEGLDEKYVLGGQGNIWTEQIQNTRHLTYMTYPRAFAMAEAVWSQPYNRNWNNFVKRTEEHFRRFDTQDLQICKAVYDPIIKTKKEGERLRCELSNDIEDVLIYYTLDDSYPDQHSARYTQAFEIPKGNVKLRAVSYRNGKPIGRLLQVHRDELLKRAGK